MAWRNFPIIGCEDCQGLVTDVSQFTSQLPTTIGTVFPNTLEWLNIKQSDYCSGWTSGTYMFGNSNYGYVVASGSASQKMIDMKIVATDQTWSKRRVFDWSNTNYVYRFTLYAGVDDENEVGTFFIITKNGANGSYSNVLDASSYWNSHSIYLWLKNIGEIQTYQWQSVPSISGKNGILSLTTLKNELITGDTVSGLTDSDFNNFASETMLQNLVQDIPYGEEVPLIYGGQVDYLAIERLDTHLYDIKIYIGGSSTPVYSRTWTWSAGLNAYLAFIKDDENYVAKMAIARQVVGGTYVYDIGSMTDTEMEGVWLYLFSNDNTPDDVNEPEDDGGANDPWHDTAISGLTLPTTSAIETGFTSMYEMPLGNLQDLSTFLWSDSFLNNVKKFFNDPREIIVALSIMPIAPDTGTAKNIIAGGVETTAIGRPLTSQYKLVTLGSIYIKKSKKRRFLNYPPFTKITAHLPYCGEHSLDVNDIMGKTLTLKYLFDFLSGSCVAEIDVDDKPRYFYGGNCGVQIPTSSEDYSRIYSSILSAGATVGSTLSTIATKGLTAPLAISMATNLASNGMNMTPDVQYSSGSGCINGMLSSQTAFIMVETPKEKIADEQDKFIGRTSIITRVLENCTGYTKCLSVHLDNIACLETERNEIETLLLNGVRIETGSETPTYSGNKQAIIFLKCISDKDIIGKSWLANTLEQPSNILTLEGKLLYDKDILNPTVLISGDILAYNYCYIPLLNRFYYITGITARTGAQEEINLKCDVLQSWKSGILANQAIIERQENEYNTYLQDSMLWTQNNKDVAFIPFQDDVGKQVEFKRENNTYILTIAGSDPNV